MVTKYIPRKAAIMRTSEILIILKKDLPIGAQVADVAAAIKNACPKIFKKKEPFPTVRMVKFKEDEIVYKITEGKGSRAKVGPV